MNVRNSDKRPAYDINSLTKRSQSKVNKYRTERARDIKNGSTDNTKTYQYWNVAFDMYIVHN